MFRWIITGLLVAFFLYFFAVGFYTTFLCWRGTWPDAVGVLRLRLFWLANKAYRLARRIFRYLH